MKATINFKSLGVAVGAALLGGAIYGIVPAQYHAFVPLATALAGAAAPKLFESFKQAADHPTPEQAAVEALTAGLASHANATALLASTLSAIQSAQSAAAPSDTPSSSPAN